MPRNFTDPWSYDGYGIRLGQGGKDVRDYHYVVGRPDGSTQTWVGAPQAWQYLAEALLQDQPSRERRQVASALLVWSYKLGRGLTGWVPPLLADCSVGLCPYELPRLQHDEAVVEWLTRVESVEEIVESDRMPAEAWLPRWHDVNRGHLHNAYLSGGRSSILVPSMQRIAADDRSGWQAFAEDAISLCLFRELVVVCEALARDMTNRIAAFGDCLGTVVPTRIVWQWTQYSVSEWLWWRDPFIFHGTSFPVWFYRMARLLPQTLPISTYRGSVTSDARWIKPSELYLRHRMASVLGYRVGDDADGLRPKDALAAKSWSETPSPLEPWLQILSLGVICRQAGKTLVFHTFGHSEAMSSEQPFSIDFLRELLRAQELVEAARPKPPVQYRYSDGGISSPLRLAKGQSISFVSREIAGRDVLIECTEDIASVRAGMARDGMIVYDRSQDQMWQYDGAADRWLPMALKSSMSPINATEII